MLPTNSILSKDYVRENVVSATLVAVENNSLLLKTNAVIKNFAKASSDDDEMFARMKESAQGEVATGRLLIEVFKQDCLRVRFFKGEEIGENNTPMVTGSLDVGTNMQVKEENNTVTACCGNLVITIALNPYSLTVYNTCTGKSIKVGGFEKNFFNVRDSLNTGLCYIKGETVPVATENFALSSHEAIYGFGEKFIKLNKVGQTIEFDTQDGIGIGTPRTYKNVPFYVSTNGYGVFFNHSSYMTFFVGSMYAGDIQATIQDNFLDYYIFTGSIKDIIGNYTLLTGRSSMPAKWSFGYWQSKITYHSAEELLDIVHNMRKKQIPMDLIHVDTHWFKTEWFCDYEFDKDRFSDPEGLTKELKENGVHLSLWQLPYVRFGSRAFDEFKAVDGFVKNKDGEMYDLRTLGAILRNSPDPVGVIDFTNPNAIEVYKNILRRLFDVGVSVIKTDFGEAAPSDGVYYDGTPGYKMHNLYPLLYNKVAYEVTSEYFGDEAVVWGRSAYAGNQRYPLYWGGDSSPNLANIIPQLVGGLSFGMCGFPFWSQDVGGFLGRTNGILLIRWMQFSVLMSHIRIHGGGDRELYKYSDECIDICKKYLDMRYSLLPYLWAQARKCCETSLPVTRALAMEYQNDPNVWNIEDEYMSGDSLLVAPIYTEDNKRSVYLPEGVWTDWHTGERIVGGKWMDIVADLDILPLYVREGSVIPVGPRMNYVNEKNIDSLEIRVYPFESDGRTQIDVETFDDVIPVMYEAKDGKHTVYIPETDIKLTVKCMSDSTVTVVKSK